MKVALRVKELVDARGWDVRELAHRTGVDEQKADDLYHGRTTQIDLSTFGDLCTVLGVEPAEILVAVEEQEPSVIEQTPPSANSEEPARVRDGFTRETP